MKRRDFIKRVAPMGLLPFAINGQPIRAYGKLLGTDTQDFTQTDKVLVLIQLNGGNDGLNTLIPLDQYSNLTAARPDVILPENKVLSLNGLSGTGIHPAMSKLRDMYNDGKMHIVQNVGYPNQNYSHFRSTDIWLTGSDSDEVLTSGWVGRYLAEEWPNYPEGFPNEDMEDPLAIQIGSLVSPVCQGPAVNMGLAISNPTNFYQLLSGDFGETPDTWAGKELSFVRTAAYQSNAYALRAKAAAEKASNLSNKYPDGNSLANQLKIVAQLIAGGLKTRVYIVTQGGFDTHANQVDATGGNETGYHASLLQKVSEAIDAFQDDIELLRIDDRVLGMTFSEFGRRVVSNGSVGTDHGSAAPLFLFGSNVKSGMTGKNPVIPSNASVNTNLPMEVDFRSIYSTILQDWFCLNKEISDSVLLHNFDSMGIITSSCNSTSISKHVQSKAGNAFITNYPNPFGSSTTVRYYSDGGLVNINVLDSQGRIVELLVSSQIPQGSHEIVFDASRLSPGTYYCQYQNGMVGQTKSLLKVR